MQLGDWEKSDIKVALPAEYQAFQLNFLKRH